MGKKDVITELFQIAQETGNYTFDNKAITGSL